MNHLRDNPFWTSVKGVTSRLIRASGENVKETNWKIVGLVTIFPLIFIYVLTWSVSVLFTSFGLTWFSNIFIGKGHLGGILHLGALVITVYFVLLGADRLIRFSRSDDVNDSSASSDFDSKILKVNKAIFSEQVVKFYNCQGENEFKSKTDTLNKHLNQIAIKIAEYTPVEFEAIVRSGLAEEVKNLNFQKLTALHIKKCLAICLTKSELPSEIVTAHTNCRPKSVAALNEEILSGAARSLKNNVVVIFVINILFYLIVVFCDSLGLDLDKSSVMAISFLFICSLIYELVVVADERILDPDGFFRGLESGFYVINRFASEVTNDLEGDLVKRQSQGEN
jgi:hypothetical protein